MKWNLRSQSAVAEAVKCAQAVRSGVHVAVRKVIGNLRLRRGTRGGLDLRNRSVLNASAFQITALLLRNDESIEMNGWRDQVNVTLDRSRYAVVVASEVILASLDIGENAVLGLKKRLGFCNSSVELDP